MVQFRVDLDASVCANGTCMGAGALGKAVVDSDNDTYSNVDEVQGHSDPTNKNSTPMADDDGDCTANARESDFLAAQGIEHPTISFDAGLTFDPNGPSANVNPDVSIQPPRGSSC